MSVDWDSGAVHVNREIVAEQEHRGTVFDIPLNPVYTDLNDLDGLPLYEGEAEWVWLPNEVEAEAAPDETEPGWHTF